MFRKKIAPKAGRQRPARLRDSQPAAFSYYSRRSDELLNTGRQIARTEAAERARKAGRYWRQRFGFGILLLTAVICLVYLSSLSTEPRVVPLSSSASQPALQDPSVYQQAGAQLLSSSIWNSNKITVSTTAIARQMEHQFPELSSVNVALPMLTHRPVIYVQAAEPVLLLATTEGTYALDSGGHALLTGAQLSGLSALKLPLVTDQSGLKAALRSQVLTTDNVAFILTVAAQLKAKGLTVASMNLPAGVSELDVRLEGQPYFIKFNLAVNSARQQAGTFLAVYDRLKEQGTTPATYVDVRVDGRAYYK